jgi:hypothetical protein
MPTLAITYTVPRRPTATASSRGVAAVPRLIMSTTLPRQGATKTALATDTAVKAMHAARRRRSCCSSCHSSDRLRPTSADAAGGGARAVDAATPPEAAAAAPSPPIRAGCVADGSSAAAAAAAATAAALGMVRQGHRCCCRTAPAAACRLATRQGGLAAGSGRLLPGSFVADTCNCRPADHMAGMSRRAACVKGVAGPVWRRGEKQFVGRFRCAG